LPSNATIVSLPALASAHSRRRSTSAAVSVVPFAKSKRSIRSEFTNELVNSSWFLTRTWSAVPKMR
jgi:hypothetical protein